MGPNKGLCLLPLPAADHVPPERDGRCILGVLERDQNVLALTDPRSVHGGAVAQLLAHLV